ncbi:MAG TPA: N-methyl-L-tryptophan oxidase [Rubrobacteraceae bacterium]|nr:N-methyl-L-tryptophan oxidase [Rubrobacteraceae bacterium]
MSYDVIVVGLGGMGSAAAYHLARRGERVLGLERYSPAHDKGSSHGRSRIIRQAYFEGPEYVPLLLRAYELWEELERESERELVTLTGGLMIGRREGALVSGSVASADEHDLPYEMLEGEEIRRRFPAFSPTSEIVALFETRAGFVRPEETVRAHLDGAAGADLRFEEPVLSWEADGSGEGVRVETPEGIYEAGRIVISPGAWAPRLLADLGLPLEVTRQVMYWFEPTGSLGLFSPERFPIYIWEPDDGAMFYGFPVQDDDRGVKAAFFRADGVPTDPETIDRVVTEEEAAFLRGYLAEHIPELAGRCLDARACMYTNTPDEHFVISAHPDHAQVVVACGFSGHGYKFCSVVGEILADLATDGSTRHPIDLFSPARLTDATRG